MLLRLLSAEGGSGSGGAKMPSERQRWETLEALKRSSKGQLSYCHDWPRGEVSAGRPGRGRDEPGLWLRLAWGRAGGESPSRGIACAPRLARGLLAEASALVPPPACVFITSDSLSPLSPSAK